jgi:hypothetical protein
MKIQRSDSLVIGQLGGRLMRIFLQHIFLGLLIFLFGCAPTVVFNSKLPNGNMIDISGTWEGELEIISSSLTDNRKGSVPIKRAINQKDFDRVKVIFENPDRFGNIRGSVTEQRIDISSPNYTMYFGNFFVQGSLEKAFWSYEGKGRILQPYKAEYYGTFDQKSFFGFITTTDELLITGQLRDPAYKIFQVTEYTVLLKKIN